MICKIENCNRSLPKVYKTNGYCSYHYRLKNEGKDIETYVIRKKSAAGTLIKDVYEAVKRKKKKCIMWTHGKDNNGYGVISFNGKRTRAHRLSLMLYTNQSPTSDVFCCHICDVPACINPTHLYWGDGFTNSRDKHFFI